MAALVPVLLNLLLVVSRDCFVGLLLVPAGAPSRLFLMEAARVSPSVSRPRVCLVCRLLRFCLHPLLDPKVAARPRWISNQSSACCVAFSFSSSCIDPMCYRVCMLQAAALYVRCWLLLLGQSCCLIGSVWSFVDQIYLSCRCW
jgi:hypothetical protein